MTRYLTTFSSSFLLVMALMSLFVCAPALADEPVDASDGVTLKVTKVLSGQEVKGKLATGETVRVRVLGIDCADGKAGKKAKKLISKLVKGQTVTLESTREGFPLLMDNQGRLVAYLRLDDGTDVAATMLEKGQCTVAMWRIPHPRKNEYASLDL